MHSQNELATIADSTQSGALPDMLTATFSLVIPVYMNEGSIPDLLRAIAALADGMRQRWGIALEAVFVVDGSPDQSFAMLSERLPHVGFKSQLHLHARNFGSFAAIRTGLGAGEGQFFGVMAADLQEPPELMLKFAELLQADHCDVAVGVRSSRADPWRSKLASTIFWRLYRRFVLPEMPFNGVDVFACSCTFRDHLMALEEAHSSLVGLVYWLGFRRAEVPYERRARAHGKSGWTFKKKVKYLMDSVFSFTDLPIRMLTVFGMLGLFISIPLAIGVIVARVSGLIAVPGYAATMVAVAFFGAINALGLGVIGSYAWRTYENTKSRPLSLVRLSSRFGVPAASRAVDR